MAGTGWAPDLYLSFGEDRARPARDLLAALPPGPRGRVVDLGCEPGNSTAQLAARFPEADLLGVDPDAAMLTAARKALPQARFVAGRAEDWRPDTPPDLIFANASLQWAEDLPRLLSLLAPGGALAVQMPDNLDEPSHRVICQIAACPEWRARPAGTAGQRQPLPKAAALHRSLRPGSAALQIWRTVYQVELPGPAAIADWFAGSALRPYLAPLDPAERTLFQDHYTAALAPHYPPLAGGQVLLGFQRLFFTALRA